jgi:hypothetical protein
MTKGATKKEGNGQEMGLKWHKNVRWVIKHDPCLQQILVVRINPGTHSCLKILCFRRLKIKTGSQKNVDPM